MNSNASVTHKGQKEMMRFSFELILVLVSALGSSISFAEDTIYVDAEIPYKSGVGNESVRRECNWNTKMPHYMVEKSKGRIKIDNGSADAASGKKLKLLTTHVHTAGWMLMSGPKWLTLEGTLTQGENLIGSFVVREQAIYGSMKACGTLEELSEDIADEIIKWLNAPSLNAKLGDEA